MQSIGWYTPTLEDWQRLWLHNPALKREIRALSRGWVLEEKDQIVGFLCNLAQSYQLAEQTLLAAVAAALVVAPDFRGQSLQLCMAYARQTQADLLINTTASPQASKVFQFLKFQKMPQPHYDRSYYWVLRTSGFLQAALRKKGIARTISRIGGVVLAPLLWGELKLRRRGPRFRGERLALKILDAEAIDHHFDELWHRKLAGERKLWAFRTSETLRWHYGHIKGANRPFLTCAYKGDRLFGFAAFVRQDAGHIGLKRARLADLFVERDDPDTIRQLLEVGVREARQRGAEMLEIIGFPPHIRRLVESYRPFELRNEAWPYLYKSPQAELQRTLASPDLWYPCLFDGDGSL
jgi:hypothetical protein